MCVFCAPVPVYRSMNEVVAQSKDCLFAVNTEIERAGLAYSVWRLAMGWTVRGWNSGWGEIFHTRPDRPWGPPSLLNN